MEQEPSFFGLAHPDITMRHRLMHAGAGVWFGLFIGVIVWLVFFNAVSASVALYLIGASMCLFALIGLIAPKWLVDSFLKTLIYMP